MRVTAGIFLASILLKEIRFLVYIRYLCSQLEKYDRYLLHSDKIGLNQLLYEDFAHFETPFFTIYYKLIIVLALNYAVIIN
jgi:hypothetical protein